MQASSPGNEAGGQISFLASVHRNMSAEAGGFNVTGSILGRGGRGECFISRSCDTPGRTGNPTETEDGGLQ